MTGYLTDLCALCYDVFTFVPGQAPTTELHDGSRSEICEKCNAEGNVLRLEMGKEEIPVMPGTYLEISVS